MTDPLIDGPNGRVPLREYIERVLAEQQRQLEVASTEREKAAQELRDTQYRAMEQAEREREKAASAMRVALDRSISEGDDRLREHIANQVMQINAALASAEKLEVQRMRSGGEATDAVRRELSLIVEASKQAVQKAEGAQEDVNKKNNEFRGQLADQAATLMPRKEAEARAAELDRRVEEARDQRLQQVDTLSVRINQLEQNRTGDSRAREASERNADRIQPWQIWAAGVILAIIVLLSNNVV